MRRFALTVALLFLVLLPAGPAFGARVVRHRARRHHVVHHRRSVHHRRRRRRRVSHPATATAPISALLLADIHFDPLRDPAKAPLLDALPVSRWAEILSSAPTPNAQNDYAEINKLCPIKPLVDPDQKLWQSALAAIHKQAIASHVRFAVLAGDLTGHQYDCRYKLLFPKATHTQYLAWVKKSFDYTLSTLRDALPGIPVYVAMGNNDSGCGDNKLSPHDDDFLAATAPEVAEPLPATDQPHALRDVPRGFYGANLPAPIAHTRILVLDDIPQMMSYKTCSNQTDATAQDAQLAWLAAQLKSVRAQHQQAWVLGHVPPGVNLYSTYNLTPEFCAKKTSPVRFLSSDRMADLLGANSDVVRLALFGHSHTDELRLLRPEDASAKQTAGVPVKILPSISPVFAELPSFTVATIDPRTATMLDYSVIMASNATGVDATWAPSYTYSKLYDQRAFDSAALSDLIAGFQSDPGVDHVESSFYIREYRQYFFDDNSVPIQANWHGYACGMDHISAASFTECACSDSPDSSISVPVDRGSPK